MAIIVAVKTGVFSDPTAWNLERVPAAGDTVHLNGNDITIDQDVQADLLSTSNTPGYPFASGQYVVDSIPPEGRIIDASVAAGAGKALRVDVPGGGKLTINGDVTGGAAVNAWCVDVVATTGPMELTINGEAKAQNAQNTYGLGFYGSHGSTINIQKVRGGSVNGAIGVNVSGNQTINIGELYSGTHGGAAGLQTTGSDMTITCGRVEAVVGPGITASGAQVSFSCTGDVIAGTNPAYSTSQSNHYLSIDGDVIASPFANAIFTGVLTTPARIGGRLINGENGHNAITAPILLMDRYEDDAFWTVATSIGTLVELSNSTGSPEPKDVRDGILYGSGNTVRGTLKVPPPESVAGGVPIDDTMGSSALRLPNVSAIIGAQIAASIGE